LKRKFCLNRSPIDERDFIYKALVKIEELSSNYDRESECSPIRDQGINGFCYAFTGEAMKEQQEWKEYPELKPIFSPLFITKNCKDIDGIPGDEGSNIRSVMEILLKYGVCYENSYKYDLYLGNLKFPEISPSIYTEASKYKIKSYALCNTLDEIKHAIYNNGLVLGGILVCTNFMNPENGFVDNPEGKVLGLHAITIVGWNDNLVYTYKNGKTRKGFLKCRNSWGEEWGLKGYFYLPYDFYNGTSDTIDYFFEAYSSIDIIDNPIPEPVKKYWRVQLGAYSIKDNCIKKQNELKALGFSTYIVYVNGLWKIQCGAFLIKSNAEQLKQKLVDVGYKSAWITYY
jgi:C1A family cysteine protease